MTRVQAIKQATKRWGAKACIWVRDGQTSPERREKAMEEMRTAKATRDRLDEEIRQRLAATEWYQALLTEKRAATKTLEEARGRAAHFKFAVGRNIGFANEIVGSGDTWEEAFAQADKRDICRA